MLYYNVTVLLEYTDCTLQLFINEYYFLHPIMLALCLILSITVAHYTHNYVGIIDGSLFVEVLDHSLIQQQCFCYARIIM